MDSHTRDWIVRWSRLAVVGAVVACCLVPYVGRLRHPSLYGDDIARLADLQTKPLAALLFRPFNEHMAPFFEAVSWLAWQGAGHRLTNAPMAFTVASVVPFVLCVVALGALVRRETGSPTTALAAMTLFGLSPIYVETVSWYSACSFTWALFWTLIVLLCARSAEDSRHWSRLFGMAVGSLLAPASSAIGLLAGPLGLIRLAAGRSERRDLRTMATPLSGTFLYLAACSLFKYYDVLDHGVRRTGRIAEGLVLAFRAPTARLVPGIIGLRGIDSWLPSWLNVVLTAIALIVALYWARRSTHRGLLMGGLWLVFGGYALTYGFRNQHGAHWLFGVERFHLFPQLGLALLLSLAFCPRLRRYDGRPVTSVLTVAALALFLLAVNVSSIEQANELYHFPEQHRTLVALERLGDVCRTKQIARDDCLSALDPVWTHWFQQEFNGLTMLPPLPPAPARPVHETRAILLAELSLPERQALWGGMDVSRLAQPAERLVGDHPDCLAAGRLTETYHAHRMRDPLGKEWLRYSMTGWPAYLEFDLTATDAQSPSSARVLSIPCGPSPEPLEIWWADDRSSWSESRCVRLRPDPREPPEMWSIPLQALPHWKTADASRLRIRFAAGPITIGVPRLLR